MSVATRTKAAAAPPGLPTALAPWAAAFENMPEAHTRVIGGLTEAISKLIDGEEATLALCSGSNERPVESLVQVFETIQADCEREVKIQRYKGLGEMMPAQLFESTMDPAKRTLYRVTINDAVEADGNPGWAGDPHESLRRRFATQRAPDPPALEIPSWLKWRDGAYAHQGEAVQAWEEAAQLPELCAWLPHRSVYFLISLVDYNYLID